MELSRRTFLEAGLLAALPTSVYRNAFAADEPPSERVRTAMIGVGNQGGPKNNLLYFNKNVVAICDVDKNYLAEGAAFVEKKQGNKPATYADFRRVLDAKDVDAVVVTVPDQWHAYMTIEACKAGKDVYCEKPLTLVIDEGPKMIAAARKYNRIVQTGTMQRSGSEYQLGIKLLQEGILGKISAVNVILPGPNWIAKAGKPVPDSAPPADLDYDMWIGPAPMRKYNKNHVHYLFRFYWDYSGGQQTNFGAHHLDIAQWGLGMDASGPVSVEGTAVYNPDKWYETPDVTDITYTYASGVIMKCKQIPTAKGNEQGTEFIGEKGKMFITRGRVIFTPKEIAKDYAVPKGESPNMRHVNNFYDCIKSRKLPAADVSIGHRSATVCHLGNIAVRSGKKIIWDPAKETIVGDTETAKWLTKEYGKPWQLTA
jgi:predicted dehydrogenase